MKNNLNKTNIADTFLNVNGLAADIEFFEVKEYHLKLIERFHFRYEEGYYSHGIIVLGDKRPYGNSDIEGDICEIIGIDLYDEEYDEYRELTEQEKELVCQYHHEALIALVVCTTALSFKVGKYQRLHDFSRRWKFVG